MRPSAGRWLRENLFNTWYDSLLTVACVVAIAAGVEALATWALASAQWTVIDANFKLFFAGRYPVALLWRLWVAVGLLAVLLGMTWGVALKQGAAVFRRPVLAVLAIAAVLAVLAPTVARAKLLMVVMLALLAGMAWLTARVWAAAIAPWLYALWLGAFPVILWLLLGGFGLARVNSNDLTGLVLTLLTAVTSIVLCFPFGVLAALGRQSDLPVVRWLCIAYIEIGRGIPLIGLLFLAQVMLPLFFPMEWQIDRVLRAIAGLTIFSSVYLAENVRGGLQSIPTGQAEAARALGLNPVLVVGLITLPQALKAVIPALVGQFIALFKNTALLSLVGFAELVGISRSILANPAYIGRYAEVYLFVGAISWVFCFGMSFASQQLEKRLSAAD